MFDRIKMNDSKFVDIARKYLASDSRVEFHVQDGSDFLKKEKGNKYDFIFADTWPGKYWDFEETLELLSQGGIYIIDDLMPQDSWPEEYLPKVSKLIDTIENLKEFIFTKLAWSTGIIIITKSNRCSRHEQAHAAELKRFRLKISVPLTIFTTARETITVIKGEGLIQVKLQYYQLNA